MKTVETVKLNCLLPLVTRLKPCVNDRAGGKFMRHYPTLPLVERDCERGDSGSSSNRLCLRIVATLVLQPKSIVRRVVYPTNLQSDFARFKRYER